MTKAEIALEIRRVLGLAKKWQALLLPEWEITWIWYEDSLDKEGDTPGYLSVFKTKVLWPYKQCQIRACLPVIAGLSLFKLEKHVVHELLHGVIAEAKEKRDTLNHEERTVVELEQAIRRVTNFYYRQGIKKGKTLIQPREQVEKE